ncbi:MAG: hypothetical protein WA919_27845 [Coleofasciculaceae cyanobacterium]
MNQVSIGSPCKFQPNQIVCLEHDNTYLYSEVIEVVESRQTCWVRPLMLVVAAPGSGSLSIVSSDQLKLYDLRLGADLLWPTSLFRPAIDTEVIPLLLQLDDQATQIAHNSREAHQQLSFFVHQVWQFYKRDFQAL